jgi:hypothetical protein
MSCRRGAVLLAIVLVSSCTNPQYETRPHATAPATQSDFAITVGEIEADPPTFHCLGVSLPIVAGDKNYNAQVLVSYRREREAWRQALPLLRVRPETMAEESVDDRIGFTVKEQFAGSIFDLEPDTAYEVRVDVQDPDGGGTTKTVTIRTRPLPKVAPATPRAVSVADMSALRAASAQALPGDVITLADGTYRGALELTRNGTETDPIFVRGQSQSGVVLDAAGATYGLTIRGAHVTVENFTIQSSDWGMRVYDTHDVVIRRMRITDVSYGIDAAGALNAHNDVEGNDNHRVTICDNVLQGKRAIWPRTDRSLWNFEGIVITGSGHVVCHNTISGFGDALGLDKSYGPDEKFKRQWHSVRNRAIDFFGNDVLWGGDDGIELDLAERNVRAFRNRFANTSMGISFQPIWGGPAYAIRNVIYNVANRVYKLNNDPTGFYILHNTSVVSGIAMLQPSPSGRIDNMKFFNNVLVGNSRQGALVLETRLTMNLKRANVNEMDYNGWYPEGPFTYLTGNFRRAMYPVLAFVRQDTPLEHHSVALKTPIFETFDLALPPMASQRAPLPAPKGFTLHNRSSAIDAGRILPNINDDFVGKGPDLGAQERGRPTPFYGVRPETVTR